MTRHDAGGAHGLGDLVARIKPGRRIEGISAVLMPFTADGPDFAGFERLVMIVV